MALIKSIPEEYFDRIADMVYENMASAQRWDVPADRIYHDLDDDLDITMRRANTIARDQTSKMNAAFRAMASSPLWQCGQNKSSCGATDFPHWGHNPGHNRHFSEEKA